MEQLVNATVVIPEPLVPFIGSLRAFFGVMSWLLGGLFGLYFLFLLLRFFYDRKILGEIVQIKKDIKAINRKLERKRRK